MHNYNLYHNKYRLLKATRRTYFGGGVRCYGVVERGSNASDLQFITEIRVKNPTLNTRNTCKYPTGCLVPDDVCQLICLPLLNWSCCKQTSEGS